MNKYSNFSKNVNPATTKVTAPLPDKAPAATKSDESAATAPDAPKK